MRPTNDGIFEHFTAEQPKAFALKATFDRVQSAGRPRKIPLGKIREGVAPAPEDADFAQAAVWRIKLPDKMDLGEDPILRLTCIGDVARISIDGKLFIDDFCNGSLFDVGLRSYAPQILAGGLRVAAMPLRQDAPIYLTRQAKPSFGSAKSVAALREVGIIPR